jgi:NADH-quinone oxidoreductase subunit K
MNLIFYVVLALILFSIGGAAVLTRKNAIIALLGVEIMLNSCNLALVAFSRMWGNVEGQVFSFFVMVVAAAEVVVGLAIVISVFKTHRSASLDGANQLRH